MFTIGKNVFTFQRISDILVGAFEGGSNYWMASATAITPIQKDSWKAEGEKLGIKDAVARYQVVPFIQGNGLKIKEFTPTDKSRELVLNIESITKALELMSVKHSRHFSDIIEENDDAETSDVLVQLAVFGQIVYG